MHGSGWRCCIHASRRAGPLSEIKLFQRFGKWPFGAARPIVKPADTPSSKPFAIVGEFARQVARQVTASKAQ